MGVLVQEVIDFCRAEVRAECAILPADRRKIVNRRLLVGDRFHQFDQRVEGFEHCLPPLPISQL